MDSSANVVKLESWRQSTTLRREPQEAEKAEKAVLLQIADRKFLQIRSELKKSAIDDLQ
jgi:hypothetical protein